MSRLAASGSATGGKYVTIKLYLTKPAPAGGLLVLMSSSSSLVPVPPTMVVPGGATSHAIKVKTGATSTTTAVTVSASSGGATMSKVITVKEPYLSSLSLQTVIRAGGNGKVTIRISGIAPSGGIVVKLTSDPSGLLALPSSVTVPAGAAGKTLIFPASMVEDEEPVTVTASYDGRSISKPTVVRNIS